MLRPTAQRFLLSFSYCGTNFIGSQFQYVGTSTVASAIELCLSKVLSTARDPMPKLTLSSRTDSGVHALQATASFVLERKIDDLSSAKVKMNEWFDKNNLDIRISSLCPCESKDGTPLHVRRGALQRTYHFKLASVPDRIINNRSDYRELMRQKILARDRLDVFNNQLITVIGDVDVSLLKEAAKVLSGQRNFSAFTPLKGRLEMLAKKGCPVKTMTVGVEEDAFKPLFWEELREIIDYHERVKFILLTFKAESFLFRMVRLMAGAMVDVASKKKTLQNLRDMLQYPHEFYESEFNSMPCLEPEGLYLKSVAYPE